MKTYSEDLPRKMVEAVEQRGCELIYLPPYLRDFNPIEEAFSKIKGSSE